MPFEKSNEYSLQHIPERPETLHLQVRALEAGTVPVVMFPLSTPETSIPSLPAGAERIEFRGNIGAGLYYYDPKQIALSEIAEAVQDGIHGKLLGHVQDIVEAQQGRPVAIQAVEPGSRIPIQDSLVDSLQRDLVSAQIHALKKRYPGAEIRVVPLGQVLMERMHSFLEGRVRLMAGIDTKPFQAA